MKKINIKTISEITGVSTSTVSRILNGNARKYRIAVKTEARVLAEADKLGFRPNYFAHSLNTGKTFNIGMLLANRIDSFLGAIMEGVESFLRNTEYQMVVATCENDPELEKQEIDRMFYRQVDGIIIYPSVVLPGQHFTLEQLNYTNGKTIPFVVIGRPMELNADHVLFADYIAGKTAAEEFMTAGMKKFAVISLNDGCPAVNDRVNGFVETLLKNEINRKNIITITGEQEPSSRQLELLAEADCIWGINTRVLLDYLVPLSEKIDVSRLLLRSLGKPDEKIFLAGVNIHTCLMPSRKMGLLAAEKLLARINGDDSIPETIRLDWPECQKI